MGLEKRLLGWKGEEELQDEQKLMIDLGSSGEIGRMYMEILYQKFY